MCLQAGGQHRHVLQRSNNTEDPASEATESDRTDGSEDEEMPTTKRRRGPLPDES